MTSNALKIMCWSYTDDIRLVWANMTVYMWSDAQYSVIFQLVRNCTVKTHFSNRLNSSRFHQISLLIAYSASRGCAHSMDTKFTDLKKFRHFSKNAFFLKNLNNDQNREKSIFSQSSGKNENRTLYHKMKEEARATPKTSSDPKSDEISMRTVSDKIFFRLLIFAISWSGRPAAEMIISKPMNSSKLGQVSSVCNCKWF